jgi:hypothetical protein
MIVDNPSNYNHIKLSIFFKKKKEKKIVRIRVAFGIMILQE